MLADNKDEAFCYFNNTVAQILLHLKPITIHQNNWLAGQCKPTNYCTLMPYAALTAVVQTWNFWMQKWRQCHFQAHKAWTFMPPHTQACHDLDLWPPKSNQVINRISSG